MARKRMIDPEFWSDEEIGRWSHSSRLFYIGLWNFADDEGRFKAHPDLLKSQIFPYEQKINIEKLKKETSSKIQWYESNGSKYGYLCNFLKHQRIDRPTSSKLPNPPQIDDISEINQGYILPNISKDNISKYKSVIFSFEELWIKYPKRVGRKQAERHFKTSVKTEQDWKDINRALENYLRSERVAKGFIQNGSTWFNQWQDWINLKEDLCPKCKGKGKFVSNTGFEVICNCPAGVRLK